METAISLESSCLGINLKTAAGWLRLLSLHPWVCCSLRNQTPGSPTPPAWLRQSSLKPGQLRTIAPSRTPVCFAGTYLCKEATPEMFGWWMRTRWAQQLSGESGDGAGSVSLQRWPPRAMARAEMVWLQRRFKEHLEACRTAAGEEKLKRAVSVQSSHMSMGYPATMGLGNSSDPLEGHTCSSRWDFEGYHDVFCLQFKV